MTLTNRLAVILAITSVAFTSAIADNDQSAGSILAQLPTSPERIVSTIPMNGDVNPYGVAVVPAGFPTGGMLAPGNILVSNFNSATGGQGTGTTIVSIAPGAQATTFFQGKTGLGLTTALGVLRAGFVVVGNLPTNGGTTPGQGSLLVIDHLGNMVANLTNPTFLDGPWDLTINDQGNNAQIFVSGVLNGTVTRLDVFVGDGKFHVTGAQQIAHGYTFHSDPAALVIGPTGLAYNRFLDLLYVASTGDNEIFAIPFAAHTNKDVVKGLPVYKDNTHLHGPLGLALAPNGHLITANGDAVNPGGTQNALVEFTQTGQFVAQFQVDPGPVGAAFGLAFANDGFNFRFAAVNDNQNMLDIWVLESEF